MQFSLDRKRRSHKQNQCSASDSVGLIFTRSYHFTLLITTPTTTPSLKQILASCILLLCQISIMTSYPVVVEGQQKQDVFYRDNANNGVIMEENALHHHISSSDQRNVTLSSFLNLFPAHARVAWQSHYCEHRGKTSAHASCSAISGLHLFARVCSFQITNFVVRFAVFNCCCESAATDEREKDHKYEN